MGTLVCHHTWLSGASKISTCLSPSWFSFSDFHSVALEWKPSVCVATWLSGNSNAARLGTTRFITGLTRTEALKMMNI